MRISIQFKPTKRLDLDFGYDTPLFRGMYWFTVIIVYLDKVSSNEYGVVYAVIQFKFLKHYKYWFK